jgi:co-chaperonin GroES (HSP10)
MKTNKVILPKNNIVDINERPLKKKNNELEKVPVPTGFRIVLFPLLLKKKTKAGLHLTDETIEQSQIATNICKVLKVGPDAYKDKERFPNGPWCKEDDWVLITKYAGARIRIEGGELRIINDDEILATVDDPRDILPATLF